MPKLNRWLITSIIDDIKELIEVANEMCTRIGKVEHFSWRYPTRSARNVNAMAIVERQKGSAGEMYILLLEMAYDRMHFVLRLVVEFMDGYPFVEEFFKEINKIKRPTNISIANLIRTLWERLKLIPETITENMIKTKHLENRVLGNQKSLGCQISGSFLYCESCLHASKMVKNLTNIISNILQTNNLPSVIFTERESFCVDDLFEKTQWAIMTKLVDAIESDIKTLLNATLLIRKECEARVKDSEISLRSFKEEMEKHMIEKSSLEIKIIESIDQLRIVEIQLANLKDTELKLIEENRTLIESISKANEKLLNFEILLAVSMQQTAEVAESKLELEKSLENLQQEITTLRQTSNTEKEELQKSLNYLQAEKISKEEQFREEIETLKRNHAIVIEKLEEDLRISVSDQFSKESEFQFGSKKMGCENADILIPKGDPGIDMAEQFVSNKKTIERLTRQNERLSKTLTRLREHRKNIKEI